MCAARVRMATADALAKAGVSDPNQRNSLQFDDLLDIGCGLAGKKAAGTPGCLF